MAEQPPEALAQLMDRWAFHHDLATRLKAEIATQVLALGYTVETINARATWSTGRGAYDWEALGTALRPSNDLLHKHAQLVIDWRAVCQEVGVPDALTQRYYRPNPDGPRVTLRLAR